LQLRSAQFESWLGWQQSCQSGQLHTMDALLLTIPLQETCSHIITITPQSHKFTKEETFSNETCLLSISSVLLCTKFHANHFSNTDLSFGGVI
jgi:hypothetical protein